MSLQLPARQNYAYNNTICCNATPTAQISDRLQLSNEDISYICVCLVIALLGVFGNMLVIKWFLAPAQRKNAGSVMVITLALNDMIASVTVPSLRIHLVIAAKKSPLNAWYLGQAACYTFRGMNMSFLLATSWILVVIAAERYRLVKFACFLPIDLQKSYMISQRVPSIKI